MTPPNTGGSHWLRKLAIGSGVAGLGLWFYLGVWPGRGNPVADKPLASAATGQQRAAWAGSEPVAQAGNPARAEAPPALQDALCQELATSGRPQRFAATAAQRENIRGWLTDLSRHPDPAQRAAAMGLHAEWSAQAAAQALRAKYPNCENDNACREQMQAAAGVAYASGANQLAQLALNSHDVVLYASAFYTCNPRDNRDGRDRALKDSAPFCQQISAAQWAERDPQNGIAWLFAAQQAQGKPAEMEQALFRWSQAKQFEQRLVGLPQLQASGQLAQQAAGVQLELARLNHQVLHQHAPPEFGSVINYCRLDKPGTSNRRQVCEAIAQQLLTDQTLVVTAGLGAQIGRQLGWEAPRLLEMVKQQRQGKTGHGVGALSALSPASVPPLGSAPSGAAALAGSSATGMPKAAADPAQSECLESLKSARADINTMQYGEMDTLRKKLDSGLATQVQLQDEFLSFELKSATKPGMGSP
jgi:hypothetical protein